MTDGIRITVEDVRQELARRKYAKLIYQFPDTGNLRRELYPQHMEFIAKTLDFREVCFMAANRVGKSETGAFCVATWLTGLYPDWWTGRRFGGHVNILVCGETSRLVRDSMQAKLLGDVGRHGTGLIPRDYIIEKRAKSGVPDAVDTVMVKHALGGQSVLQFQSYDQGREAFQATARDVIWEDEEPPLSIHAENLIRTMTTGGLVMLTFTPLKGVSETVLSMQAKAETGAAVIVQATWDDAPHLSEKDKAELLASLPPHQREARSKGVPALGSGAVYQVPESAVMCEPFQIPKHYRQLYGLDVGWNNTAACWGAHDVDNDIIYVTGEYKRGQCEPALHASAIKARGEWITGAIDPASRGRTQTDGAQIIELYKGQGLKLQLADNTVEAGIFECYERFTTGRLKIFSTCRETMAEYRLYRRDEKGKIVKINDHLMDAMRYMVRGIGAHGVQGGVRRKVAHRRDVGHESWLDF